MIDKKKPTIEELEDMLNGPGPLVEILPNGELNTVSIEDVVALREDIERLQALLREHAEWEGLHEDTPCCPACGRTRKEGHNAVCSIAAALGDA